MAVMAAVYPTTGVVMAILAVTSLAAAAAAVTGAPVSDSLASVTGVLTSGAAWLARSVAMLDDDVFSHDLVN